MKRNTISLLNNCLKPYGAIFFMALLCITACNSGANQEAEEEEEPANGIVKITQEQIKIIGITIGQTESRQMSGTINATGTLQLSPQNQAEVTSLLPGIAKSILVKQGDFVRKGQTIALVENAEVITIQREYLTASRDLTLKRQAYERQESLHSQGAGIYRNLQQAQADLDIAQVTEQGLRQQLQQFGISPSAVSQGKISGIVPVTAPISGMVGEILISTGTYLANETVLMNIYDNRSLHADLKVFERDITNVHLGQSVTLILSDDNNTTLDGKVSFVTAAIDEQTKAASVHVDILSAGAYKLLPNMFVSAAIHCEESEVVAVPDEAVVSKANRYFIFVKSPQQTDKEGIAFVQTEVVKGLSSQGYTQITFLAPPASGDIVTSKAFYLQSMLADHGEEE